MARLGMTSLALTTVCLALACTPVTSGLGDGADEQGDDTGTGTDTGTSTTGDGDTGESTDESTSADTGESTDESTGDSGTDTGSTDTTTGPICGDMVTEGDEECDDGNDFDGDDCTNECKMAFCGDGIEHALEEECDDGNDVDDDGCDNNCLLPPMEFLIEISSETEVAIPAGDYDGSLESMACSTIQVGLEGVVVEATITAGIDHPYVGDTVVKLVSPAGTVITLHSRPGYMEVNDDGIGCCGDESPLAASSPVSYNDDFATDAEAMGKGLVGTICADDNVCEFIPNAGAATPGTLADLVDETVTGEWRLCVGDAVDVGDPDGALVTWQLVLVAFG